MVAQTAVVSLTFLTHYFGSGLSDERFVVERYRTLANGEIRPFSDEKKRTTASRRTVRNMRPARNEIIICTGLVRKGGIQYWGDFATGLYHRRGFGG